MRLPLEAAQLEGDPGSDPEPAGGTTSITYLAWELLWILQEELE